MIAALLLATSALVLPYFEVSVEPANRNFDTRFTITNSSPTVQCVRVAVWTDHGTPVLWFNTAIPRRGSKTMSMRDMLVSGKLPICNAASSVPSWLIEGTRCALTTGCPYPSMGTQTDCSKPWGGRHAHAIGYVTIDLMAGCEGLPSPDLDSSRPELLRSDPVLAGTFQQIANGALIESGALSDRGGLRSWPFAARALPADPDAEAPSPDCSHVKWYCVPPISPPEPKH